jgi:hypothetical protein
MIALTSSQKQLQLKPKRDRPVGIEKDLQN